MRLFNPLRILSIPLLSAVMILWTSSVQAGPCADDPKLSPDGLFAAAKLAYEKAEKAKSDAEAEITRLKALIDTLPGRINYAHQLARQASDGYADEKINLDRLIKDLKLIGTMKDRIDPRLENLIATLKGLVFHQLHVEDAWLRTTLRTDIHSYGDMKVFIKGQFAGKKINLAMDWDFKKSESNFIRLGEALLAGSYSFQGASDVDLGFLSPDPEMQFSCQANNLTLSVKDQESKDGQPVVFWPTQAGTDGQVWYYKDNTLVSKLSKSGTTLGGQVWEDKDHLVLSVAPFAPKDEDGNIKSGANLILKPRSGNALQRWKKVKHPGNGITFENRGTNLALGCDEGKKTGASVHVLNKEEAGAKGGWEVTEIHMKKEEKATQEQ